uniref:Uncharacterized protein n=1 Tax=Utricularia reniformis TaxID=192314 RepID=A0A1Y0AZR8_9LAMI|nr:hypothetical protein AEK19_MT0368 [Utricularia reniformis]ART30640.1 hypothetical protein AEK19_MT0368 [Utricularia reniformis]
MLLVCLHSLLLIVTLVSFPFLRVAHPLARQQASSLVLMQRGQCNHSARP